MLVMKMMFAIRVIMGLMMMLMSLMIFNSNHQEQDNYNHYPHYIIAKVISSIPLTIYPLYESIQLTNPIPAPIQCPINPNSISDML